MQSVPSSDGFLLLTPILRLVGQLRDAGVPVSSSEVIDATRALTQIDLVDRRMVRSALASTLIKRAEDLPAFGILFELHFAVRPWRHDDESQAHGRHITTSLDRVGLGDGESEGAEGLLDMIMEALRRGDEDALRALAEMAVTRYGALDEHADSSERYFMHRVLRALELSHLMAMAVAAARAEDGAADEPRMRVELAERIDAFKRLIASEVRNQLAETRGEEAAIEAFRRELDRGYLAMVATGPGKAEQVRELPLDADTVILRRPIAGG
jgi:uncharacterized protein with von Willebrand factor type A (vWA) domain